MFNGCSIDEEIDEVTLLTSHPEIPPLKDVLQNMKLISMTLLTIPSRDIIPIKKCSTEYSIHINNIVDIRLAYIIIKISLSFK